MSVSGNDRVKSLRSDVTRTFSFSGPNRYSYHDEGRTSQGELSRLRKQLSMKSAPPPARPSLSYMSHDSQLVLPTQRLVPDPRRTQTCHEFQSLPTKSEHRLGSLSPDPPLTPDDIEVDAVHPRQPSVSEGRVRVNHMVQCMHPALKARGSSDSVDVHSDCLLKVLYSIHREIGFSDEEYSAINQLVSKREVACSDRPTPTGHADKDLEFVWGCDYELVQRHPLRVTKDTPMIDCAEMTFHVKLEETHNTQSEQDSLLKVCTELKVEFGGNSMEIITCVISCNIKIKVI